MSLFDAPAPQPVTLTGSTTAAAPQYLTDYLTELAKTGTGQLGKTSTELLATVPTNLKNLYKDAETRVERYEDPMDEALTALKGAAQGISPSDISAFYDPYQSDIIDEMTRQSGLNVQQNLLPALRGAFAGTGSFGSQRYAGAAGQTLADVQSDLYGNQAKLKSEGYKSALDAALRSRGYDVQAGQALGALGGQESAAGVAGIKALGDIGTQELAYEQAKIDAPLTRAQNVAQLLRGYTYPTTTTDTKQVLPSAYGLSPIQQIGGLGSLVGAAFGNKDAAGYKLIDLIKGLKLPGTSDANIDVLEGLTDSGYGTAEDYT